jgi:hypothetical protein
MMRFELGYHTEQPLPHDHVLITVHAGIAWITAEGEDHFLTPGMGMVLLKGEHVALISSISKNQPLVYDVAVITRDTAPIMTRRVRYA